jgi:hypothetical protein
MKRVILLLTFGFVAAAGGFAQTRAISGHQDAARTSEGSLEMMPRDLEIRFALSALPPSLREKAAVYVLEPAKGFVLARVGTNGQNCFVERTEWKVAEYRNDLYTPICYDAAGSESQMLVRFDVAELRAKGLSPQALKEEIEKRFRDGAYRPPSRAGFSYMAAPLMRTYASLDPSDKTVMTMVLPHIMYYAPNLTNADVGGISPPPLSPYPFVFEAGSLGYIVQRLGDAEAAKIVANEADLLKDLCSYRSYLCLKAGGPDRPASGPSK